MSIQGLKGKWIITKWWWPKSFSSTYRVSFSLKLQSTRTPNFPNELWNLRSLILLAKNFTLTTCQNSIIRRVKSGYSRTSSSREWQIIGMSNVSTATLLERLRDKETKRSDLKVPTDFYFQRNAKRRPVNHVLRVIKNPESSYINSHVICKKHNRLQLSTFARWMHPIFHLWVDPNICFVFVAHKHKQNRLNWWIVLLCIPPTHITYQPLNYYNCRTVIFWFLPFLSDKTNSTEECNYGLARALQGSW